MGAPLTAYNRISNTPIRIHSNIYEPDYVVVVDDSLLECVDVTAGLKEDGAIVINTTKDAEYLFKVLKDYKGSIYTCLLYTSILAFACSGNIKKYAIGTKINTNSIAVIIYFLSIPATKSINISAKINANAVP